MKEESDKEFVRRVQAELDDLPYSSSSMSIASGKFFDKAAILECTRGEYKRLLALATKAVS